MIRGKVVIGKQYRNLKNGRKYVVKSIGLHTELDEITVHYQPLYKSEFSDYYRPLDLFKVKFEEA